MNMLVIGDSVTWGQSLLPGQKFSTLVYEHLFGQVPSPADMQVLAHSGAIIGVVADNTKAAVDGEVPDSYPTIVHQCDTYAGDANAVKVVIVNGGINDVDAFTIVNPLTDADDLRDMITEYCYQDMLTLLDKVARKFGNPATQFVVPSYFPILSDRSDPLMVPAFLGMAHGINLNALTSLLGNIVFDKIYKQCEQFYEQSNKCLAKAVADVNIRFGGNRFRYAQVPFTADNAALAPNAWLWGITRALEPEDPMQAARHLVCNRDETDLIRRQICYRASAGHPNVRGAEAFSKAIQSALT